MTTIQGILHTTDYIHFQIHTDTCATATPSSIEFEGAHKANKAFSGDTVSWSHEQQKCTLISRDSVPVLSGILEIASKTTYGLTSRGKPLYLFIPFNASYPSFIVGCSEKDRSVSKIAVINFDKWDTGEMPRGNLQRILGNVGDLRAEEEALLIQAFPWQSLRKPHVSIPPLNNDEDERMDKRIRLSGFTFNVDPEGCRDIDDVLTFEETSNPNVWKIIITIADVASRIEELSAIDILASTFGQTLYKDGEAICPMLPPSISEEACSLLPAQERLGVSLELLWDRTTGSVLNRSWYESIFTNNASFTYEDFERCDKPIQGILKEVASSLEQQDLTDSHKWIETMMKTYNLEAGRLLKETGVGILRRHTAPQKERLTLYSTFGLAQLAMSGAEYCSADEQDTVHFGLASSAYCHATSPLRRYADLMNQRILKQIIRGNKNGLMVTVPIEDLNRREKATKRFEKRLPLLRTLLHSSTTSYDAIILDLVPSSGKIRVWIPAIKNALTIKMQFCSVNGDSKWISKDEKQTFSFKEGDHVNIELGINLLGRRWADRIIRRII